jgi:hypothetical protein
MNRVMEINHKVIPKPDPEIACGSALKGGYTVQPPEAGPDSMKSEAHMTIVEAKKNQ